MLANEHRLISCFWELTRRCELGCIHCRARGGAESAGDLSLEKCLEVAEQLVDLGGKRVVLTGGEPVLYEGWNRVAKRLVDGGVVVRLFTSGVPFTEEMLKSAVDAGVSQFAVSVDGPAHVHNGFRPGIGPGVDSPFQLAIDAAQMIADSGAALRAVTQVNKQNVDYLSATYRLICDLGAKRWQVHLCQANGRARDYFGELMCEPRDLEKIVSVLLLAARERKLVAPLHCTVGYNTLEEPILRARESGGSPVWLGCRAGISTIGIANDGKVRGCTTLPDEFATGDLNVRRLKDIWSDDICFPYTRNWSNEVLAGACEKCPMARTCKAGCPAMAYGATGTIGANPYCLRLIRES